MNGQIFNPSGIVPSIPYSRPKDWFIYPILFSSLAQASSSTNPTNATNTFQIDAATDFYLTALTYKSEVDLTTAITVSTYPVPYVTVQISDGGSQRNLFQASTPIYAIAGDGNHPHKLIHPRLFVRNSAIVVTVSNYSTNTTYNRLYLNFEGFKIFQ